MRLPASCTCWWFLGFCNILRNCVNSNSNKCHKDMQTRVTGVVIRAPCELWTQVNMETIATFVGIANRDMLSEMGMSPGAIDEELKIVSIFKCTFQLSTVLKLSASWILKCLNCQTCIFCMQHLYLLNVIILYFNFTIYPESDGRNAVVHNFVTIWNWSSGCKLIT